ncbi:hypothetical protein O181_126749 [Austropuccinia psidii MF-1]|uniref:Uncharacterized protein n=1 Tax=Austropuccinia psidii MF-1 TaxID=1389203 RepID=A0A9Q3KWN0_9BASI|nr:hypothetical protein [Austropuccinia psidii MF-1]
MSASTHVSLKAQTHINTICKVWVITPHGASQQFGMLIFVYEMTSTMPPDNLTTLKFLLSCMNWLPDPCLILSDPQNSYAPTLPSRYASAAVPPYPPSRFCTPPYDSSHPLLTILMLILFPPDMPPTLPSHPHCLQSLCSHGALKM